MILTGRKRIIICLALVLCSCAAKTHRVYWPLMAGETDEERKQQLIEFYTRHSSSDSCWVVKEYRDKSIGIQCE